MTSTTFDRPYMQRKPMQKVANGDLTLEAGPSASSEAGEGGREPRDKGGRRNGELSLSDSYAQMSEPKSDPENEDNSQQKQTKSAKISKCSSFSFGHSSLPHPRLLKPVASKGATVAEKAESATPPTQSKLKGPGGGGASKLQAPAQKAKDGTSAAPTSGGAPQEPEAAAHSGGGGGGGGVSRLKFPGGGRSSTPSNTSRSGIQRPSSRLNKMGSNSTSNLVGGDGEEEGGKTERLKLQRKASDGAIKRHLVAPSTSKMAVQSDGIQSGTASLPRHLPKGSLSPRLPGKGGAINQEGKTVAETASSTASTEGKTEGKTEGRKHTSSPVKDAGAEKSAPLKAEGAGFGLKRPSGAGLKKPGASLLSGVRTPNLPSSGPKSSSTTQGEPTGAERNHTPSGEEGVAAGGSPSAGKKLMQPKTSTGGMMTKQPSTLESRLKRAASPSAKHKLHRIAPASTGHAPSIPKPSSETKTGHTLLLSGGVAAVEPGLCSSSSSLDSEVQGGAPEVPSGKVAERPAPVEGKSAPESEEKTAEVAKTVPAELDVGKELGDVVAPPTEEKTTPTDLKEESGKEGHLRFGRRISPEGMSHEEISSPKGEMPAEEIKPHPSTPPTKVEDHLTSSGDADSTTSTEKEKDLVAKGDGVGGDSHLSRYQDAESAVMSPSKTQRARSLSPKSPSRLLPKGMARVRDLEGGAGLTRTTSSESTSSEGGGAGGAPSLSRKPLKSSMRQKRNRHSSSSSLEGVISPSGPRPTKVTISPRSSQVSNLTVHSSNLSVIF